MRLKIFIFKIYESVEMERTSRKKGKNRKYEETTIRRNNSRKNKAKNY